jgi:hypothetical protein
LSLTLRLAGSCIMRNICEPAFIHFVGDTVVALLVQGWSNRLKSNLRMFIFV